MISFRLRDRKRLLQLGDLLFINLAAVLALAIHASRTNEVFGLAFISNQFAWFLFFSFFWVLASSFSGVYEIEEVGDFATSIKSISLSLLSMVLVYMGVFFFTAPSGLLPRGIVLYQTIIALALLASWRLVFLELGASDAIVRKVIIVGAGSSGATIAQTIVRAARKHFRIIGFVDDTKSGWLDVDTGENVGGEQTPSGSPHSKIEIIGKSDQLRELVDENNVSEVIIAVTHDLSAELYNAILECRELGVHISKMPALYEYLTGRVPIEYIGENWNSMLPFDAPAGGGLYEIANRLFDIVGALFGLILLVPFFPLVALAIFIDSPGPIFYSQMRVGKGGKQFCLHKLRTMIPDAEKAGPQRAVAGDPRLTRVGRILRKVRLDEMPQLINVLKGEMSAVGPRPERPGHLEELDGEIPFHRLRNAVKPGMAGWAAVNYGYIESLEDAKIRLEYDLYYVKKQSLWLDLRIMAKMVLQVFQMRGR